MITIELLLQVGLPVAAYLLGQWQLRRGRTPAAPAPQPQPSHPMRDAALKVLDELLADRDRDGVLDILQGGMTKWKQPPAGGATVAK